jgi:hypothetical protein
MSRPCRARSTAFNDARQHRIPAVPDRPFSGRVSGVTAGEGSPHPPASRQSGWRTIVRVLAVTAGFLAIAELGALVLSEYVGTAVFSWLLPGLLGAGSGELASTVAYPMRRSRPTPAVRAVVAAAGVVAPVVATLQAFRIADVPFGPVGSWLPPVVAAVVGAVLMWRLPISGQAAPRGRKADAAHQSDAQLVRSGMDDDL